MYYIVHSFSLVRFIQMKFIQRFWTLSGCHFIFAFPHYPVRVYDNTENTIVRIETSDFSKLTIGIHKTESNQDNFHLTALA